MAAFFAMAFLSFAMRSSLSMLLLYNIARAEDFQSGVWRDCIIVANKKKVTMMNRKAGYKSQVKLTAMYCVSVHAVPLTVVLSSFVRNLPRQGSGKRY